jgi:hypothetical protein
VSSEGKETETPKLEAPLQEELRQIPRLPRGGGFRISTQNLVRIAFTAAVLVMIIVIRKPCADHVSGFVTSYGQGSAPAAGSAAGSAMPHPGTVDQPREYEQITPDMTPEQVKAAIERAKARAAGSQTR